MQIVCRNDFSLILTEKGKLYSFGYSKRGALGRNRALLESAEPGLVEGLDNQKITKLKAGSDFILGKFFVTKTLALNDKNEIFSWGLNDYGQLGHPADLFDVTPAQI